MHLGYSLVCLSAPLVCSSAPLARACLSVCSSSVAFVWLVGEMKVVLLGLFVWALGMWKRVGGTFYSSLILTFKVHYWPLGLDTTLLRLHFAERVSDGCQVTCFFAALVLGERGS